MTADELLDGLNERQREAASTIEGPVLVLSGAGTGKTRVITYRIAYMLATGIEPESILGMTFTNKAAREMRERLAALVSPELAKKVTLGTFHSFCARFLHSEIVRLGYLPSFTIADDEDQKGLIKQAAVLAGVNKDDFQETATMSYISAQKTRFLLPEQADRSSRHARICAAVYSHYQRLLEDQNTLDFDDLLLLTCRILQDFPDVRKKYQARYRYLLIDEYQDTNDVQFEIVRLLCGETNNLCVVGDDDQSIYSWRGANIYNILDFPARFPGTRSVKLEQNYRSTNTILGAANNILRKRSIGFSKKLWSEMGEGDPIQLVRMDDDEEEAAFAANYITQLKSEDPTLGYGDFAILYRSNYLSRQLEIRLRNSGIPYRLVGGAGFYQRREVKDAAAFLKVLYNRFDNQSLLRVLSLPPRGLANKAVQLLKEYSSRTTPMCDLLGMPDFQSQLSSKRAEGAAEFSRVVEQYRKEFDQPGELAVKTLDYLTGINYLPGLQTLYRDPEDARKRRENVDEFINSIKQFENSLDHPATLREFLENFSLLEENDRTEETPDVPSVTLSTVHAAKGLEFQVVHIVGLEDGLFPHERAIREGSMDEERRLFYVAVTRAKRKLVISAARRRMVCGVFKDRHTSDFLRLLPEETFEAGVPADVIRPLSDDELRKGFENIFNKLK